MCKPWPRPYPRLADEVTAPRPPTYAGVIAICSRLLFNFAYDLVRKVCNPRLRGGKLFRDHALVILQAGRDGDDHLDGVGPQRAVAHFGNGDDILGIGEADAGREGGAAGARAEMHADDVGLRVLLVEDV